MKILYLSSFLLGGGGGGEEGGLNAWSGRIKEKTDRILLGREKALLEGTKKTLRRGEKAKRIEQKDTELMLLHKFSVALRPQNRPVY